MPNKAVSEKTIKDLEILKKAGALKGFYLAGGTGLAFLLNHRESHDLDFFSQSAFNEPRLAEHLQKIGQFSLEKKEEGTLRGLFENTILSFFHYPYPLLEELKFIDGIPIASLTDIACMKIDAISSRGTKRDFVDVYAIIHQGKIKLSDLLDAFAKKYGSLDYNLEHVKKSLVYFEDAENDPMPDMLLPLNWKTVKDYFISEIKKI